MVEKTQLKGSSCKRLQPNEFLNGDVGFTLVNLNFGKQILVSPLWFASLLISLALLCASASIYLVVLFLCVQGLKIYLISPVETPQQVTFVLESKRGETLIVGRFCRGPVYTTGLTGWLLYSAAKSLIGLTGLPDRSVYLSLF